MEVLLDGLPEAVISFFSFWAFVFSRRYRQRILHHWKDQARHWWGYPLIALNIMVAVVCGLLPLLAIAYLLLLLRNIL